jgi:hypothetical protein
MCNAHIGSLVYKAVIRAYVAKGPELALFLKT